MSKRRAGMMVAGGIVALAIAITLGTMLLPGAGASHDDNVPDLHVGPSVGADFELVARETWAQFLTTFRARQGCFGDVTLRATSALDSRAAYDPDTATVTVRVPGTRAMLQSALIHEWAHHVEFQCAAHVELRPAFLAAQGLPLDTPWRPDTPPADVPASLWAGIPSEQCAEAAIEAVLGSRPVPTNVRLTREAVRVVQAWARGE